MNATTNISPGYASWFNVRSSTFDWSVLIQLCVCVIPAMATIDMGQPLLGARYLAGSLFLLLGYHVLTRNRYKFMSLLVGAGPALGLTRGLFFYDSILVFLAVGSILWAIVCWKEVYFVWRDPLWRWLACLCGLYWILSFAYLHNPGANVRAIEFVLATLAICLLSNRRSYLATAFIGAAIAASAYAIAMLPYGARLGEGDLGGDTIGNPILLGMPAALIVLLALSDRGRYLLLEKSVMGRLAVCIISVEWLILSGSRGSWLVAATCLALIFLLSKWSRKTMLLAIGVGCLVTLVVLATGRGSKVTHVFDKTVDSDRTLNSRTSGRYVQWEVLPAIFAASPVWGWGPGSAPYVDSLYLHRHLVFHSLYLQVLVETGLVGFIPLLCILGAALYRATVHWRRFGEVTPLVGIVGFLMVGVSVTAFDFISGVFLGLALMAREAHPRFVAREIVVHPVEDEGDVITI
ncbi:MAG: O-antigen ligase family protein [Candidatus Acidiferrales bacterium]